MKLLGVSLLIGGLLMGVIIGIDILLMGFKLQQSLHNVINPFRVMETPELFILFSFLLLWVLNVLVTLFRQRQKKKQT
ncbi:hypothetical protein [Thermaerobacillus caldiproteolyticus]|uniref:Group-specific protein n=1 Tax=Thermaerobacillus caldiproteolyticus TaxID=247480 RepID=A0A7V9Z7F9_9BACL|nr:hypothetical protein [Anoxybacillus caldiproteolyticus]MBA2875338.1 hypothetical protein [Anoxybacillus caldiproteolyticus]QPA32641.1 hypothetical protein ISX45_06860 [Anoxybacillus caldiproteolyticus]